jgi:hypothetical protein
VGAEADELPYCGSGAGGDVDICGGEYAGGAGVGGDELNSVGAVNAALHNGQNVALPANSSETVTGSWQLGQNTRMTSPSDL